MTTTHLIQDTEVLREPFAQFAQEQAEGDILSIGVNGTPPVRLSDTVMGATHEVETSAHEEYQSYLPDEFNSAFDTVLIDTPPLGYLQRGGVAIASEETVAPGGTMILRTSGRNVPGWGKTSFDDSSIKACRIDVNPDEPYADAKPVFIYTKARQSLSDWM